MKCLIMGGRGFIGSHLCDALTADGHSVRVFDRPAVPPPEDTECSPEELYEGDFTNKEDLAHAVKGCDVLFHLISTTVPRSSHDNPVYDIETNVIGSVNLLESALAAGVKKIIFVSSGGTVYGIPRTIPVPETHPTDPVCAHGIAKLTIEKYIQLYRALYGMDYRILRVANPYGERQRLTGAQGAVTFFLHKALENEPLEIWGDGSVVRDYLYIQDTVDALRRAMTFDGEPRIFNIGSGTGKSLNEIIEAIEQLLGHRVERRYLPGRLFDVPINVLDTALAHKHLRWQPRVSLRDGLARTMEWMARRRVAD